MSTEQDINPTACTNPGCEHRPSCYRAELWDTAKPGGFVVSAYFSRDPMLSKSRGFDCYWSKLGVSA